MQCKHRNSVKELFPLKEKGNDIYQSCSRLQAISYDAIKHVMHKKIVHKSYILLLYIH